MVSASGLAAPAASSPGSSPGSSTASGEFTGRSTGATSGADGSYRLEGLVDAQFTLSIEARGYTFRTAAGADWSANPGAPNRSSGTPS